MKTAIIKLRRRLAAGMIAFASVLAISTARFEQDPQSCGMITVQLKKKKNAGGELQ
ncbi:MAG TPA: hypothetical protein VKB19_05955 [Pedobacter sp.]|nr:hypothetical protein [Pedobacter sp.]